MAGGGVRVIFSRDRPAQLDLLLRSLHRFAPPGSTVVVHAPRGEFKAGYQRMREEWPTVYWWTDGHGGFDRVFRSALGAGTVTFFCDDDVMIRPVPTLGEDALAGDDSILTFSLRLGPIRLGPDVPIAFLNGRDRWRWQAFPPHDHGYPGSIDGHTFRVVDVLRMIGGQRIDDPLALETVLALRCPTLAGEMPMMARYPERSVVGVPVNGVAEQKGRPFGARYPQPADELNRRFLAGGRIDLDAAVADLADAEGCLAEIEFKW